jgi:hypothetical protein
LKGRLRQALLRGDLGMAESEELRQIVEDLIGAMHLQAKELEKLVERVEQVAGHLGYQHQLSIVASELSELHVRVKNLSKPPGPGPS